MRLATWNVNSLTARMPRVTDWIESHQPDVLCMQETKQSNDKFPEKAFADLGYESAHNGDGRWNGVAILSKVGLESVTHGFGTPDDDHGRRLVSAAVRRHPGVLRPTCPTADPSTTSSTTVKLAWLGTPCGPPSTRCARRAPLSGLRGLQRGYRRR